MVYFTIADYCVYHCKWCVLPLQMVCFTIADGVFYHCRCALPVPNDVAVACFTNARWYVLPMPDGVADPRFPLFGFYCCWILLLFVLIFECVLPNLMVCFTNARWCVSPLQVVYFYQCQMVCFTIADDVQCQMVCFTDTRWCVLPVPDGVLPMPDDVFYQCQMVCVTNARSRFPSLMTDCCCGQIPCFRWPSWWTAGSLACWTGCSRHPSSAPCCSSGSAFTTVSDRYTALALWDGMAWRSEALNTR